MTKETTFEDEAKEAIEHIQNAAEACDNEQRKKELVETRKEVSHIALEEVGMSFITGK